MIKIGHHLALANPYGFIMAQLALTGKRLAALTTSSEVRINHHIDINRRCTLIVLEMEDNFTAALSPLRWAVFATQLDSHSLRTHYSTEMRGDTPYQR